MRSSSVNFAILRLLDDQHAHLTAAQIYEHVRKNLTAVNQSTVYRALKRLVDNGEVTISDMGTGGQVFERYSDKPHHHLICQSCHKLLTISDDEVRAFFNRVEDVNNFRIITNHLILYGYCQECQSQDQDSA